MRKKIKISVFQWMVLNKDLPLKKFETELKKVLKQLKSTTETTEE